MLQNRSVPDVPAFSQFNFWRGGGSGKDNVDSSVQRDPTLETQLDKGPSMSPKPSSQRSHPEASTIGEDAVVVEVVAPLNAFAPRLSADSSSGSSSSSIGSSNQPSPIPIEASIPSCDPPERSEVKKDIISSQSQVDSPDQGLNLDQDLGYETPARARISRSRLPTDPGEPGFGHVIMVSGDTNLDEKEDEDSNQALEPAAQMTSVILWCKVDVRMEAQVPYPLSAAPRPLLQLAATLVTKFTIQQLLPGFLSLLAVDYGRWATGKAKARRSEAAGNLLSKAQKSHVGATIDIVSTNA